MMKRASLGFSTVGLQGQRCPPSLNRLRTQVTTNSKGYLEVNLSGRELRAVPPEIFQLTATQVLRLAHNYIDFLPLMIAYLRTLKVLDLQRNLLAHLPETLVNCRHLAELLLTANRLAELPRSIGGLAHLRILALGENQLEHLPQEVGLLTSLKMLDLHGNKLSHLPFSFQNLRHLRQLNISDNMFDNVPLVITRITSLQTLNLSRNRLASLPLDFDALKSLRELNLSHNSFMSICSLLVNLKHLKYLSLANNRLKFLSPQMSRLQNLRVLHLQHNNLRQVPSRLRSLQYYNVSSNQLRSFSVEGMRNIVSLTASGNSLEAVPRGLYKLKKLTFLYLDNNQLVEIDADIRKLQQLKVLDISNNKLVSIPSSLHRLSKLQSFNVKGNYDLKTTKKTGPELDETGSFSQTHELSRSQEDFTRGKHEKDRIKDKNTTRDLDKKNRQDETKQGHSKMKHSTKVTRNISASQSNSLRIKKAVSHSKHEDDVDQDWRDNRKLSKNTEKTYFNSSTDPRFNDKHPDSGSVLSEQDKKMHTKFSSIQGLKGLLFGKSKKSIRPTAAEQFSNHKSSRSRSVQFPGRSQQEHETRKILRNSSLIRHSAESRSSSRRSSEKLSWAKQGSPQAMHHHEEPWTNKAQFASPSSKGKDVTDSRSDSHGYGSWRSRGHLQEFDSDSFTKDGSSQRGYNGEYRGLQQDSMHKLKDTHTRSRTEQKRSSCSSDATTSEIVFIPYRKSWLSRAATQQMFNNNNRESNSNNYYHSDFHSIRSNFNENQFSKSKIQNTRRLNYGSTDEQDLNSSEELSYSSSSLEIIPPLKRKARSLVNFRQKSPANHKHSSTARWPYATDQMSLSSDKMTKNFNIREVFTATGTRFKNKPSNTKSNFLEHNDHLDSRYFDNKSLSHALHDNLNLEMDNNDNHRRHNNFIQGRIDKKKNYQPDREFLKKNFKEFDHVLETKNLTSLPNSQWGGISQINDEHTKSEKATKYQKTPLDEKSHTAIKTDTRRLRRRSVDSLIDQASKDPFSYQQGCQESQSADVARQDVASSEEGGLRTGTHNVVDKGGNHGRTDYSLLGVCNQLETLLNKNLLQSVIGFPHLRSRSFSESAIPERPGMNAGNSTEDEADDNSIGDDEVGDHELEYSPPQTFTVASNGGHFKSSGRSKVEVILPAHALTKPLNITVQLLVIPTTAIFKARELNYFISNIITLGPVVYFHTTRETSLNSQATATIPAPAEVKGGHLIVLTVRRDNSCIPCSGAYRSGKLSATFTTWRFIAQVAVITQAKCKYKACKSVEQLLQCVGATQI